MQPSLAETQAALLALITGRGVGARTPTATDLVVGDDRADADLRLHVYAHMYRSRMIEAMESQFPRLARHVGGDDFADLVTAYVDAEPSRHPSLRFAGRHFSDWLERSLPQSPWLSDLARLEWSRADVFDRNDQPTLTLDKLRTLPPERFVDLPLKLIEAHRIVIADFALADFWNAVGEGTRQQRPARAAERGGEALLVWRQGTVVYHRAISDDELTALEQLRDGTTFGRLCDGLLGNRAPERASALAFGWLSTWVADGLLVAAP
jgi:hypothetical protein